MHNAPQHVIVYPEVAVTQLVPGGDWLVGSDLAIIFLSEENFRPAQGYLDDKRKFLSMKSAFNP
jgi:hypothetical protein